DYVLKRFQFLSILKIPQLPHSFQFLQLVYSFLILDLLHILHPSSSPSPSIPPSPVSSCTSPPFVYSRSLPCSPTPSIIVPAVDIEEEARKDDKSIETEKISSVEVVQIAVPVDPVPGESGESIEHKVMVREKTIIKEKIETVEEAHEPIVTNLAGPVNTDSLKLEALKPDLSMEDVMEDMIEVLEPEHLEQLAIDSIGDDIEGEFLNDSISKVDTDAHEQETEADDDSTMVFGEEHLEVQLEENEKYETVSIVDATEMVEILEAEFDTEDTTQGECDENVAEVTRRPVQETRRAAQQTRRRRRSKISGKELYKSLLTECTICHKNIERNRLEGHLNRHAGRRPYSCPTEGCTARFHCKHACRLHVRCRHGTESFPCQKCDKVYKAKRDLLGHMRETHSEPRFVCDICPKKFTTKSRLKQHRHYHTNERNHPCHICNMSFFNNFQLKVHMRSHTKISPYRCTICTKEFRYRHMAKEHLTKDHGIENSAQKDWVIQFPEPDPEEVDIVEGDTNMVRYNVQRLIEPNDDDAVNVGTMN
uniref:C2H2-type domain-containing protein n=1 Tax=Anopheles dirus TaxID=7168 RepID=A0A182NGS7_9DIPT